MGKIYYKLDNKLNGKKLIRLFGFLTLFLGLAMITYIFFPLLSWQIYFAPVFANQNITSPIPKNKIISNSSVGTLLTGAANSLTGVDYTNANNWFPNYKFQKGEIPKIQFYTISIPKLKIKNAIVSTVDTDLKKHLVNYFGTAIPPAKGNAVIFGHSTLPQLYNEKDYKTIFSNLYKLSIGDEIIVNSGNITYKYIIENVVVVDPDNTSILEQNYDDSFITLVTCTPPGTIWKRLVVKGRIERL